MSSKTKATATKEEAKPALVPKLRFPEFREAERWEYSPLGKLLMKSPDYGVNAAAVPFTEGLPQYLRITDISDDGTYLSAKKVSVDLTPTEEIFLDEGDIVLARTGASVGKSYRYRKEDGRLVFAGFLIRVRPNSKRLDSTYLANFLTTNQYWKWVAATSARSGQPGINSVEYGSLEIPLPADFAEQQKIAECLSSVDELMAAQARKVDALKTHKKGLMQQLFPREGETQPCLRFPEFQNAGEWEEKTLDQLASIQSGGTPSKANAAFWNGTVPWVSAKDMKKLFLEDAEDHISEAAVDDGAKLVPPGTLLMLVRGMTLLKDVPICVVLREMSFNQDVKALRPKKDVHGLFLALLLTSNKGRLLEMVSVAGHGTGKLDTDELKEMVLMLPHPPEQQCIADCLSSLDVLITAETQKLEALKTHKKGLMQQLFPSPEEVEA